MYSAQKQTYIGIGLLALSIALALLLMFGARFNAGLALLLGLSFGYVFQRSRFCTVAAVRDVFLFRNFALAKGVLFYMTLTTISYSFSYILAQNNIIVISDRLAALSVLTPLGAAIFGAGMVIAGGCAAGTLVRMGEGLVMQWWSFLGLVTGLMLGTWALPLYQRWLDAGVEVFIPKYIGLYPTILLQLTVFLLVYLGMRYIEKRDSANQMEDFIISKKNPQAESLLRKLVMRPWSYKQGAIVLAVISTIVFVWRKYWGISAGLVHLFGGITNFFFDISTWTFFAQRIDKGQAVFFEYTLVPLVIAMIVGSHISSLLAGEFRIRKLADRRYLWSALIGGFMMGIGARLANGCNVSTVMSAIPSFSLQGWIFLIFMILGVLVGIEIMKKYLV